MQPQQPDYGFIMQDAQAPKRSLLPGAGSMLGRIIVVSVGLIVLLIIFSVVRGLMQGKSNMPEFVGLVQDQAAILHLVNGASEQEGISEPNENFVLTTKYSMTTSQSNTLAYLRTNKVKVKDKQLILKISGKLDTELDTAASNSNYNETFHHIMKTKLEAYRSDLQTTYTHTKGPKGKALLDKEYNTAGLLLSQLEAH